MSQCWQTQFWLLTAQKSIFESQDLIERKLALIRRPAIQGDDGLVSQKQL